MISVRSILVGCVTIVAFDALGAAAARQFDFNYSYLAPISFVIYAAVAFLAARESRNATLGAVAGTTVAFVDATLGWTASWLIGPGAADEYSRGEVVMTAVVVVVIGTTLGFIAGRVAARASTMRRSRTNPPAA